MVMNRQRDVGCATNTNVMADLTNKIEDTGRQIDLKFYLSILKYIICKVLKTLFYIIAYLMRKCSSLLEYVCDQFEKTENVEYVADLLIQNRSEYKDIHQVINNTINELPIDNEYGEINQVIKSINELPVEPNSVVGEEFISQNGNDEDLLNELPNSTIEELIFQNGKDGDPLSEIPISTVKDIVSQTPISTVNDIVSQTPISTVNDIVSQTPNSVVKEFVFQNGKDEDLLIETPNFPVKQFIFQNGKDANEYDKIFNTIKENVNEDTEMVDGDSLEQKIITVEDISTKSVKRRILNNSAMALITKTLRQSEEQYILDSKLNKNMVNNKELQINSESYELKNQRPKNKNTNMVNNKQLQINNESHEFKKQLSKAENILKLIEANDLLSIPPEFSIVHFITEDLNFTTDITTDFKLKLDHISALMDLNLRAGDVGKIIHNERSIFYLVIEKHNTKKFRNNVSENELYNILLDNVKMQKFKKLTIPIFENHRNTLEVKELASKVFSESDIDVSICVLLTNIDTRIFITPKIQKSSKQLWEMEKQTDLILFINMEQMYLDTWKDEVVENIDAVYPFKDRLLKDIQLKPMAPGNVLSYIVDHEVILCIFIMPASSNPLYFNCLEKAFKEIKSEMTGFRYLGIQHDRSNYYLMSRHLLLLKTVFSDSNAEIWVCGDVDNYKSNQHKQYNKNIRLNTNVNTKRYSKKRFETGKRKRGTNSVTNTSTYYDVIQNKNYDKRPDMKPDISIGQATDITENWDNHLSNK